MSGGGGGVIIIKQVVIGLSDPIVHGSLPVTMQEALAPVMAKEPGLMSEHDRQVLERAVCWALQNLT